VLAAVKDIEALKGERVRLIIGDTLARMSAGANENSGEDMGPVMARFDRLSQATGAAVLIIHHSGKDQARGARGWSGIRAHIDTEIEVTEVNEDRTASVTKQRELPSKGEDIAFRLEVVEMGTTKFGAPATTCVAVPDEKVREKRPKPESKIDQYRKIFQNAWFATGCELRGDSEPYVSRAGILRYMMEDGMRKRRTFLGSRPVGPDWVEHPEVFERDDEAWKIFFSLRSADKGYVNFKLFADGPVKSKANYWIGMSRRRCFNTDLVLLRHREDLYDWAIEEMKGIFSYNIGPINEGEFTP